MKVFKEKLMFNFECTWKDNVVDKLKLRSYVKYKSDLKVCKYVTLNLDREQRSLFAQLRLGILPLFIETGRFKRVPSDERICTLCKNGVEDEKHFLLYCNAFNDLRDDLFNLVSLNVSGFKDFDENEKISFLLEKECRLTSKYISKAFYLRKSILYK